MSVWKIRRHDGLFSSGGVLPHFGKSGKVWACLGDVKRHLRLVNPIIYKGCTIIEFSPIEEYPIEILLED